MKAKNNKNYCCPTIGTTITFEGKEWRVCDNVGALHLVSEIQVGTTGHKIYPTIQDDTGKWYACQNMLIAMSIPKASVTKSLMSLLEFVFRNRYFFIGMFFVLVYCFKYSSVSRLTYLICALFCLVLDALSDIAQAIREGSNKK